MKNLFLIATCLWLTACQSLYTGTVTLTSVVDDASKEYARLYNDGLVPADIATKASNAHLTFRKACGVAEMALTAYKLDPSVDFKPAMEAARQAAGQFIDILVPLLTKQKTSDLRVALAKASKV